MSIFEQTTKYKTHVQPHIKDFVVERIQKGESPMKIKANVQKQFGVVVSLMFVGRIRKRYIELTGEHLKSYNEFHGIIKKTRKDAR